MGLSLSLGLGLNAAGFGMGSRTLDSLFANGENGFLFANMSDLSRAFTTSVGPVNVAANDDPVGLALDNHSWGGKTLAQVLAAQPELVTDPTTWAVTPPAGATMSVVGTGIEAGRPYADILINCNGTASGGANIFFVPAQTIPFTGKEGYFQQTSCRVISGAAGGATARLQWALYTGSTFSTSGQHSSTGNVSASELVMEGYAFPAGAGNNVRPLIQISTSVSTNMTIRVYGATFKLVPGNHAINATGTQRPFWKSNSGKPYIIGDQNDDRLVTPFIPTAALTIAFAGRIVKDAVSAVIPFGGGSSGTNNRALIGLNGGTGILIVGWGTTVAEVSGVDRSGQDVTVVVTGDGTGRDVYVNGALANFAAPSGGPNGSGGGMSLCAFNNAGTLQNFSDARIYAALALNRRVTLAEVGQITSQFQRTYQ